MQTQTNQREEEEEDTPPVRSILDTDLYKFTMQQAILHHFPTSQVSYKFTNRSKEMRFTRKSVEKVKQYVMEMSKLQLTQEELEWLKRSCPYLGSGYLGFLQTFRFRPDQEVEVKFLPTTSSSGGEEEGEFGQLEIRVHGLWSQVILYEVPLMAIVSESYFRFVDTDWDLEGQMELACEKAKRLVEEGIQFSEFGTRRRRSFQVQEMVIQGLIRGCNESGGGGTTKGKLVGTSNLDLARKYGLDAIGTVAHEWTMAVAALKGYQASNLSALKAWDECYSPPPSASRNPNHDLTIALTDTFSSEVFFRDLSSQPEGVEMMRRWRGLRQDSGDPKRFAERARDFYQSIGIQPSSKVIIYSDNLNVEKSIELHRHSNSIGIRAGFGIGTNLTNDFTTRSSNRERSKPLNIVIKLDTIDDRPTVKISDDLTKNTGDPEQVRLVKRRFGLDATCENVEDA